MIGRLQRLRWGLLARLWRRAERGYVLEAGKPSTHPHARPELRRLAVESGARAVVARARARGERARLGLCPECRSVPPDHRPWCEYGAVTEGRT